MTSFKFTSKYSGATLVAETNANGHGLWIYGKQIYGTSQFSIPANHTAARQKIRRTVRAIRPFWDLAGL